jgi:hypothetical protein
VPSESERHTTAAEPRSALRGGAGKRVEWLVKAISPLLRSEFAQSTPAVRRTAISRTVSSLATKEPFLSTEQSDAAIGDPCSGRSAIMQSNHSIEPRDSAAPRARGPVARLLSVVRGDKYMADAYEPAWSALMARRAGAVRERDEGALRSAVEPGPIGVAHAVPTASTQKER